MKGEKMDEKLLNMTLKIIYTMEKWSSSPSGLSWKKANEKTTLYDLAISPGEALVQKLFKLRHEYLGEDAGEKEIRLKKNTTLFNVFEYVTKK